MRLSKCDPDLIKIDVEGHEEEALSSLSRPPCRGCRARSSTNKDNQHTTSLRSLLRNYGYKVFAISKRLTRNALVETATG